MKRSGDLGVPLPLRNAPTKLMRDLGYGKDYKYSHDYPNNFVAQDFLPEEIKNTNFFTAGSSSKEQEIALKIEQLWREKYKK